MSDDLDIIKVPTRSMGERDAERERREAMFARANPFDRGSYAPRTYPLQRSTGETRESVTVPLPSRVPLITEATVPPAQPVPPVAPKPRPAARTPKPKTPRRAPRVTESPESVLVRIPEGWKDLHAGVVLTHSAMDLIVRRYVVDRHTLARIAKELNVTPAIIRAALRVNRVPANRSGRGPAFRPALPRRT